MCVCVGATKQRTGEERAQFSNMIIGVVVSGGGDCINVACGVTTRVFAVLLLAMKTTRHNTPLLHTTSNYTWHMMTND